MYYVLCIVVCSKNRLAAGRRCYPIRIMIFHNHHTSVFENIKMTMKDTRKKCKNGPSKQKSHNIKAEK